MPDKAIDLIDQAAARTNLCATSRPAAMLETEVRCRVSRTVRMSNFSSTTPSSIIWLRRFVCGNLARELRRQIQQTIEKALAKEMLGGKATEGSKVMCRYDEATSQVPFDPLAAWTDAGKQPEASRTQTQASRPDENGKPEREAS